MGENPNNLGVESISADIKVRNLSIKNEKQEEQKQSNQSEKIENADLPFADAIANTISKKSVPVLIDSVKDHSKAKNAMELQLRTIKILSEIAVFCKKIDKSGYFEIKIESAMHINHPYENQMDYNSSSIENYFEDSNLCNSEMQSVLNIR